MIETTMHPTINYKAFQVCEFASVHDAVADCWYRVLRVHP